MFSFEIKVDVFISKVCPILIMCWYLRASWWFCVANWLWYSAREQLWGFFLGNVPKLLRRGLGHPAVGVSAWGGVGPERLRGPFQPQPVYDSVNCNKDKVVRNTFLFRSASAEACLLVHCLLKLKSKPRQWVYLNSHSELQTKLYWEKYWLPKSCASNLNLWTMVFVPSYCHLENGFYVLDIYS